MLLWSLKSWQHKCYSTSWLYKTHKQEVMHKLGSAHNIQSWWPSHWVMSLRRLQCTTLLTLCTLANAVWLGMVPSHHLPCFKSHRRASWRQVVFCWLRGPQLSLSQAVVHGSEIFVALEREAAYKDFLSLRGILRLCSFHSFPFNVRHWKLGFECSDFKRVLKNTKKH